MLAARRQEGQMNRKRRNTEEFLNPWAGEAGWKTDPQQFSVVSPAGRRRARKNTGGPRNVMKRVPKRSRVPFNWLQMTTLFLGVVSCGLILYLASVFFAG